MAIKSAKDFTQEERDKLAAQSRIRSGKDSLVTQADLNKLYSTVQNRINFWARSSNDFYSYAEDYYKNLDDSTYGLDSSKQWKDTASYRASWIQQEANDIDKLLTEYEKYFDSEWLKNVRAHFGDASKAANDIATQANKDIDYWKQFKNEGEYKDYYYGNKYKDYTYTEAYNLWRSSPYGFPEEEDEWLYNNLDKFKSSAELQAEIDELRHSYDLDDPYVKQAFEHGFGDVAELLGFVEGEGTRKWARDEEARLTELKGIATRRETLSKMTAEVESATDIEEYVKKGESKGLSIENKWFQFENDGLVIFAREYSDDIVASRNGKMVNSASEKRRLAKYMTDDEYNTYVYFLGKNGKKKANEYYESIEETLNAREAQKIVEEWDKPGLDHVFNIYANLERWGDSMESIFGDGYKPASSVQMANQMLGADKKGLEKVAWDLEGNIAYMMPSMLAGYATSTILGPAGLGVMGASTAGAIGQAGLTGLSAYGSGRQEMLNLGYNETQANAYGLLSGVSEAGLQYVLNGVGKFGGIGTEAAVKSFASGLNSAAAKFAIEFAVDMGGEFTEEWLQEVLTPFFKKIATGRHENVDWGQAAYAGMLGALSAGVMNGVRAAGTRAKELSIARKIKGNESKINTLKEIGSKQSVSNLAQKLSKKIDVKTGAWKIADLIHELNGTLSEQNKADIKYELIHNGVLESDAESIAEWLGKAVDGEYFTPAQRKALDSNPVITEVFKNIILDQNSAVNKRLNALSDIYGKPGYSGVDLYAISEAQTKEGLSDSINIRNTLNEISKETIKQQYGIGRSESYNDMIAAKVEEAKAAMNNIDIPVVENEEQNESKKEAFNAKTSKTMAVSSDGVTRLTATGEAAEISDVVSVKNGEVQVKLTNGQTVSAQELSFSTDYEAAIYEQIASFEFPPSIMKNIATKYDPSVGISPAEYLKAAAIAYTYGKYNMPKSQIPAGLSDAQIDYIYKLGQTFTENRVKQDEDKIKAARHKGEITEDMPEAERAEILKRKAITIRSLNADNTLEIDETQLKKNMKSMVEKPLLRKLREMGCFRSYKTDSVDVEFEFTGMNMRKSMNSQVSDYGGTLNDLAKIVTNMQEILDDAVLIEIHSDKAKGTKKENARLVKTYVLLSAFFDNNSIVPVQFEIKHFVDNQNRLYLVAALTKIETGVMGDTVHRNDERTRLLPVSEISIPNLIAKVNPNDANFFKYIPDEMLDAQQLRAKKYALSKEAEKYGRTFVDPTVNSDDAHKSSKDAGKLVFEKGVTANHKNQKLSLHVLKLLAKRLGLTIHVYKSDMVDGERVYTRADGTVVSGKNGWYDTKTGEIWLDINAGTTGQGLILFTASHELVHFIRQWSHAKFKILADFLMDKYGEAGKSVDDLIHQQMSSRGIKYGEAYEEVVASSMEAMLKDGKVLEKLAELEKKDHGIVQKIRTFLKNFADKLRSAYKDIDPATEEGQFFAEMTEEADRIAQLFAEALHDAGENFKKTDVLKFETSEGVKYSNIGRNALIANRLKSEGWLIGKDGKERYEISDSDMKVEVTGFAPNPQYVGDYVKHDLLFEAYPEIKDYRVIIRDLLFNDESRVAAVSYKNKTMYLKRGLNEDQAKAAFLHEFQHIIQRREGFVGGTSRESAGWALFNKVYDEVKNSIEFNALKTAESKRKYVVREVERQFEEIFDIASAISYWNYYGEVEARNTADRRDLNEAGLAEKPAENDGEIYDREKEDAKFIDNLIEIGYTEKEAKKFKKFGVDSYDNQQRNAGQFDLQRGVAYAGKEEAGLGGYGHYDGSQADGSGRGVHGGRGVRGADTGGFGDSRDAVNRRINKESNIEKYSYASTDVSTRGLLVNALESAAQTDAERKKLSQYKAKIAEIEALERRIDELVEEKRKLRADKENADAIKLREIQDEIIKTTNRIDIADKQLLRLEAVKELQNIVERQRKAAYSEMSKKREKTDVSKFETSVGVKHSGKGYVNKGFAEYEAQTALYDALDHEDGGFDNLISVGQMPEYITNLIGIEGEFYIYRNHAYENMVSKEQAMQDGRYNSKAHYHNLGIETMTDAMMSLNDPIMTISTKSKEGNPTIIMLLPVQGKNNAPLYAVLSFYSKRHINGDYSTKPHIVLTIAERSFFGEGGRAGINEVVESAISEGRVLDFDTKKRDALSVIAKTTRLGNITESSLKNNIAQFRKTVKAFKEKNKILYSSASTDVSTRGLLVNALESAAQTDAEREKLAKYKAKIAEIEALEQRIDELVEEKRKLRADKENADAIKLREIQDEIIKTTNRIDIADKQLLRLEAVKELQNIVERQRKAKLAAPLGKVSDNKPIDQYSPKQYNDFGWARHAEAISKNELDDLYSKIQEKGSLKKFMQSGYGEAIIEVNDKPKTTLGVDNVFVFVTGTKNNPVINKVVRFEIETATEMEVIKEQLYERRTFSYTYYSFLREKGLAREYSKKSAVNYTGYRQTVRERSGRGYSNGAYGNGGFERDGRGTLGEASSNEIASAFNGKPLTLKEDSRSSTRELDLGQASASTTAISEISIADFLEIVNSTHRSLLSDDVLRHFDEARPESGYYSDKVLFSDRGGEDVSTRGLLVNALESAAQTDAEREKLAKYKAKDVMPSAQVSDRMLSSQYVDNLLKNFGITSPNDYIHVQKQVFSTLINEGFFTDTENRRRTDVNEESGMVIETNKSGIDETFNDNNYGRRGKRLKYAKLATVRMLPEIIRNGHLVGDNVRNTHEGKTVQYAYIEHNVVVGGVPMTVKVDVRKSRDKNKMWVHSIHTQKNISGQGVTSKDGVVTPYQTADIGDRITHNPNFVNGSEDILFSDRGSEDVSTRGLLVNALESAAENEAEREKLAKYKAKIADIEALENRLEDINREIREIAFSRGPRDMDRFRTLQEEKRDAVNRLNREDGLLLKLEKARPLQDLVKRERDKAYKRAKERANEHRERAEDKRKRTLRRNQIRRVVDDLNRLLTRPTKEKHVPIGLQKPVADFLSAIEKNDEPKLRYYDSKIEKLERELEELRSNSDTAPETIIKKETELNNAKGRWLKTSEHLSEILGAYKSISGKEDTSEGVDPEIAAMYRPEIEERLQTIIEDIGRDVPLSEMTLSELDKVFSAVRLVERAVSNGNKMFSANSKKTLTEYARSIASEIETIHKNEGDIKKTLGDVKIAVNELTPLTLAKAIGSDSFTELLNGMFKSSYIWGIDMDEANSFHEGLTKGKEPSRWDFDTKNEYTFSGEKISLSLGELMSLYALSKRKKAVNHLTKGGFYLSSENGKRTRAYKISEEELTGIAGILSKSQREFADRMQEYLSVDMGEKGNEAARQMYGIDLFLDENYFPMKVKKSHLSNDKKDKATAKRRTVDLGMTKQTVEGANSALIVSDFYSTWFQHVNDMSLYHGVTSVEDFSRVWSSKVVTDDGNIIALRDLVTARCGKAVAEYVDALINDANAGIRVRDYRSTEFLDEMVSRTKRAAVFASLSVAAQQFSAIERAKAYIPERYFVKSIFTWLLRGHKESWAEMKKYCPVALLKEIGGYDLTGRNTMDWVLGRKTWGKKFEDAVGKLPALIDEYAWCAIWEAGKQMTASLRGKNGEVLYEKGSKEFFEKASEIVTEAINHTQVYDSIFVRSGHMRSDNLFAKNMTMFMTEQTTSVNMLVEASIDLKRGGEIKTAGGTINARRFALRKIRGVISSSIGAALAAALVYAMRDDDEEKTFIEKYVGHATENIADNLNLLNMLPIGRDIVSLSKGYDVERADMTLIADLIYAVNGLNGDKPTSEKIVDLATAISSFTSIPLKNLKKDAVGLYNTLFNSVPLSQTTWLGIKESAYENMPQKLLGIIPNPIYNDFSDSDLLYEAMLGGSKKEIERIKSRYDSDSQVQSAIRKGLRENDPRIREAAKLNIKGDMKGYAEIVNEIASEKIFEKDRIIEAVNLEINAINRERKVADNEPIDEDETVTSLFNASMLNRTLDGGDTETALEMIADMVNAKVKSGKTEQEAKSAIKSNVTRYWKEKYIAAWRAGDDEEMLRIRKLLAETKLYGSSYKVSATVRDWLKDAVK